MESDEAEHVRNSEDYEHDDFEDAQQHVQKPRELPADLPRSLDDRKNFPSYAQETEYYDAWQGKLSRSKSCTWSLTHRKGNRSS